MTEDEMVGWHHRLNGHEFEQTPGDSEGQGSLACCSSQGFKESYTAQGLNKEQQEILGFPGGASSKEATCQATCQGTRV